MTAYGGWPCCRRCSKRWRQSGRVKPTKPNRAKELRARDRIDRAGWGLPKEGV